MMPKMLTPQQFQAGVDSYIEDCEINGKKPHAPGLAWHLGFASRQSLHDYKQDPEYTDMVKRALLYVECGYAEQLSNGRGDSGIIFALKNCGWDDKQQVEHSEKVTDSGENDW